LKSTVGDTADATARGDILGVGKGVTGGVGKTVSGTGEGLVCLIFFGFPSLASIFHVRLYTNYFQGDTLDSTVSGVGATVGGPLGGVVGNVGKGTGNLVTGVTGGVGDGVGKLGKGDIVGGLGSTIGGLGRGVGGLFGGLAGVGKTSEGTDKEKK
jgi:hypothetical protein